MISDRMQRHSPVLFFLFLLTLALYSLLWAKRELYQEVAMAAGMAKISVSMARSVPAVSQQSLDVAMAVFGIDVGPNTALPLLDLDLADRGLTSRGGLSSRSVITIGPPAFSSWGLLGSTLAHEVEIHGRQNFFAISFLDMIHLDGTGAAERQAYQHEISSARRFSLPIDDKQMIAETMEYYYPEKRSVPHTIQLSARVQKWLSRNILRERGLL